MVEEEKRSIFWLAAERRRREGRQEVRIVTTSLTGMSRILDGLRSNSDLLKHSIIITIRRNLRELQDPSRYECFSQDFIRKEAVAVIDLFIEIACIDEFPLNKDIKQGDIHIGEERMRRIEELSSEALKVSDKENQKLNWEEYLTKKQEENK